MLEGENWYEVFEETNTNKVFSNFSNILNYHFALAFPITRYLNRPSKPTNSNWMTNKLEAMRNELCLFSDLSKKYPGFKEHLKELNKDYAAELKNTKRAYYDQKITTAHNKNKAIWNIISHLQNKNTQNDIKIFENDVQLEDDLVANNFNQYFARHNLNNIRTRDFEFLKSNIPLNKNSFFLAPVTAFDVVTYINRLKPSHSSGYDEISNNLLKKCKHVICQPLSFLINLSFIEGVFPEQLKLSLVRPLFKKGDANQYSNYRSITLLSGISKLFEMAVNCQLADFCKMNNIISPMQHGFVKNKGTDTALFTFNVDIINALDARLNPLGLFIDFSRAFDCIDHLLLVEKLYRYGIRGNPLNFIKSYLDKRKQIVQINKSESKPLTVSQGVPQGSVLGPLLYIIFANDLLLFMNKIPNLKIVCYADDTNFLIVETTKSKVITTAKSVLDRCTLWSQKNFIHLNKEKTTSILFNQRLTYELPESVEDINVCTSAKLLGVTFDYNMKWYNHINSLCSKLRKSCYALRSISKHCSKHVLTTLYYANFHSQIRYGILNWGASSECQRVFKLQKFAIRIITGLPYRESCREAFKQLHILTVANIYIYEIGCYVYKNFHTFTSNRAKYNYSTRFKTDIIPKKHSTALYQKNVYYNCCKIYNFIPAEIKNSPNINIFKNKLKAFLVEKNCYTLNEFFI